eukprot:XP_025012508.1 uncharacterized protein LOC112534130 [Ricinus communis]
MGTRLCVPDVDNLRKEILEEAHYTSYSVHLGSTKMYHDLKEYYWWNGMKRDVAEFISKCLMCQQVKLEHHKLSGLLQPHTIPEQKWERITMDFVSGLPKTSAVGEENSDLSDVRDRFWQLVGLQEVGERKLAGKELVQISSEKILIIHEWLKTTFNRQKSYANPKRKHLVHYWGVYVLEGVPYAWCHVIWQGRQIGSRYVGPFEIIDRTGEVAYKLELLLNFLHVHPMLRIFSMCKGRVIRKEVGEWNLAGLELVQIISEKISIIRERLQTTFFRQKSYADPKREHVEISIRERAMVVKEHGEIESESEDSDNEEDKTPQLGDCSDDSVEEPIRGDLLVARLTLSVQMKDDDDMQ